MAARKLVRDLLMSRPTFVRQPLTSHQRVPAGAASSRLFPGTNGFVPRREFSVFNDLSKKLKGEIDRNQEFQQSVKDLKEDLKQKVEGLMGVKEDLETRSFIGDPEMVNCECRTKHSAEQLHKLVDGVRVEAESTAKKVYTDVEEKISAAKAEVKDSFGFAKQESSEFSGAFEKGGSESTFPEGKKQDQQQQPGPGDYAGSLFGKIKSGASFVQNGASTLFQKVKEAKPIDVVKKGYDIVKDELKGNTGKRKHLKYTDPNAKSSIKVEKSSSSDIVVLRRSKLRKKFDDFLDKLIYLWSQLRGTSAYEKTRQLSEPAEEIVENVRDWLDTTDNPVIDKFQNIKDKVFVETDVAATTKEIKLRDPKFSLTEFVADVQDWIKPVLDAYFKANAETLKIYCTPEVIERCTAVHNASESQDLFLDNKILHISELDVPEMKMMGDSPIIIVRFQTQQVHCIRDRHGVIREGGKDTIHTVYHAWALQQIPVEELGEDALHPIWRLREMQEKFAVQALI